VARVREARIPLWSAPAERSGDGALDSLVARHIQSRVALRLPPHCIRSSLAAEPQVMLEQCGP
jgi:hypothetical protein